MSGTDVFISYSREDKETARSFANCLTQEGFRVWWDAALHSGETFDEVIERQLRAAKAVVVLWSPNSVTSRWVRAEATLADRRNRLAPVIIAPCDRPIIFELTHTTDLSHWAGDVTDPVWRHFLTDLHHLVESDDADAKIGRGAPARPGRAPTPAPAPAPAPVPAPAPPPVAEEPEGADCEQTQFFTQEAADALFGTDQHCLELTIGEVLEQRYPIGPLGAKVGRAAPADIVLADPRVSRTHCMVELKDGELIVSDLGSTNGTFVDDERIMEATVLPVGSVLKVGNFSLVHEVRARAEV